MHYYIWILGLMIMVVPQMGCGSGRDGNQLDEKKIMRGQELYLSNGCAVCHGPSGDGKGIAVRLSKIKPTNFSDLKTYKHGTDRVSIQNVIRFGVKDESSIMPAFQHLTQDELEALSQYLSSLQKK